MSGSIEICLLNDDIHHHHTYSIYVHKISIETNKTLAHSNESNERKRIQIKKDRNK